MRWILQRPFAFISSSLKRLILGSFQQACGRLRIEMESNELIIEGEFVSKDAMLNQWGWNQPRGACQPPSSCRQVPAKDLVLCRNSKVNHDALPFFPCFLGSRKNPLASDQGGRSFPNQSPRFTRMTRRLMLVFKLFGPAKTNCE